MSEAPKQLEGPDLRAGVAAAELSDGAKLLGHVDGEPVILVRSGESCFAVGATCTHYGGPLKDGLVVGDTVRCPWHHACFNLRTGAAARPPALNPVTAWTVEESDGRVAVTGRAEAPRALQIRQPAQVVIIGAGAAGQAAAETLRAEGHIGRITLLGGDGDDPVDRPNLSKDYLAGTAPEEWMPLRSTADYAARGIELVRPARAVSIDPKARRVHVASGAAYPYDALILATGSSPVKLDIPGADLPHVHTLRTLSDSRAIIARAATAKSAVVIGASFIGLEAAASLRARGLEVAVVAPGARPLQKQLGAELGDFVRKLHEEHGVVFHLGQRPVSIGAEVLLNSGASLPAELVVVGVGVRPEVELAERAGLKLDDGVLVTELLESSVSDIWVAGDLARWYDRRAGEHIRVEHWVVAQRLGQIAARNAIGRRQKLDLVPFFWSQHYDVSISYVGYARRWDRVEIAGSLAARDALVAYRQDGKIVAVATVGRDHASLQAELALERGDGEALEALVRGG